MTTPSPPVSPDAKSLFYPESDNKPMADNTLQFEWIVTIKENIEAMYSGTEDVFVAGDLLWYPVEGNTRLCAAPDTMVAFGRPKGYRGSYKQWEEGGIAPQVVFEILSPSNKQGDMADKLLFFEHHGVEECYYYDPNDNILRGWVRGEDSPYLGYVPIGEGWVSPRLGIRFEVEKETLGIFFPNGERFRTFQQLKAEWDRMQSERDAAVSRMERMAAQLRALGVEPE